MSFTTKTARELHFYLRSTDANYAFNKLHFRLEYISSVVRGFVGVKDPGSDEIEGAFCWGIGDSLESVVFSIDPRSKAVGIHFLEYPSTLSPLKAQQLVKQLLAGLSEKLHDRMIERSAKDRKKTSGAYTGPRLEAWKRLSTLPANKFAAHTDKFTDEFARQALKLHVTYK